MTTETVSSRPVLGREAPLGGAQLPMFFKREVVDLWVSGKGIDKPTAEINDAWAELDAIAKVGDLVEVPPADPGMVDLGEWEVLSRVG